MRWVAPHLLISEGDVGEYVLLPGDPGRAERIAGFLENPRLVSRNREFVVITGGYRGVRVSAVSTGIGGPSTAIALEELARCGAKVFIRVGTCGALRRGIPIGAVVIPYAAVRLDGVTKRYVAPEYPAVAHPAVFSALTRAAGEIGLKPVTGIVVSDDRFYVDKDELLSWARLNTIAVEMEASTVMVLSSLMGLYAGAILVVDGNIAEGSGKGEIGGVGRSEYSEAVRKAIDIEIAAALRAIEILKDEGVP